MIESCSEPMAREDFGFRLMKTRKFLDGHVGVFDFLLRALSFFRLLNFREI